MPFKLNIFSGTFDEVTDVSTKVDKVSSTDNAVTRYDGTSGDLQDSTVTIDDSGNVIIPGDLTVNGTTTTINTANLDVTDKNITVNNSGNDVSAEGAGLTIERVGTDGSFVYEDALTTKFKIGALGSEVEIADISSSQTITGKSINALNNAITNISDIEISATANIELAKLQSISSNRALLSNGVGKISTSTVTNVELEYLSGVTSAIQTQIDVKLTLSDLYTVTTTSGTVSLSANSLHLVDTSSSAATLTLPAPAINTYVRIKDNGNSEVNNITINPNAAETIDGESSVLISSDYGSILLISDGTNWFII